MKRKIFVPVFAALLFAAPSPRHQAVSTELHRQLANFLLGVCYVVPAGLIYKNHKTQKTAVIGALVGSLAMALGSLPVNYFITYPVYYNFMPEEVIIQMYRKFIPSVDNIFICLLIFNVPFTFVKAILSSAIVFPLYKPLSPILKGKNIS